MPEEREELRAMILNRALEKTADEWMDVFVNQTANVAAETFLTTQQGMDHPQIVHNRHVVDVDDPTVGPSDRWECSCAWTRLPAA